MLPCLTFFELKISTILKSSGCGLEKRGLVTEFISIGVFPVELSAYQVAMVCIVNLAKIALTIYILAKELG